MRLVGGLVPLVDFAIKLSRVVWERRRGFVPRGFRQLNAGSGRPENK